MDRIGAAFFCRVEDAIDSQVTLAGRRRSDRHCLIGIKDMKRGAVGVRVNGHGRVSELATGADDAHGNLAAIGDQNLHGSQSIPTLSGAKRRDLR